MNGGTPAGSSASVIFRRKTSRDHPSNKGDGDLPGRGIPT